VIQEDVPIIEFGRHDECTTNVLPKQMQMKSSGLVKMKCRKTNPHMNDPSMTHFQRLLEPQARSRSHSPHLVQKADHLIVSGDYGSKCKPFLLTT
jgi:hypothetical protein